MSRVSAVDGRAATRVVLADDDVLFREGLAGLLTGSGFEVVGPVRQRPTDRARAQGAARKSRVRHPDAAHSHERGSRTPPA